MILTRLFLLYGNNPTDPLIASEGSEIFPGRFNSRRRSERVAQILWGAVYG